MQVERAVPGASLMASEFNLLSQTLQTSKLSDLPLRLRASSSGQPERA